MIRNPLHFHRGRAKSWKCITEPLLGCCTLRDIFRSQGERLCGNKSMLVLLPRTYSCDAMPRNEIQRTVFSGRNINAEVVVIARSFDVSHRRSDFSRNSQIERCSCDTGEFTGGNGLGISLGYLISVDANDVLINFFISTLL